ncbi:MAG: radical SAM protein [Victivallaceae bacterium]
MVKLVFPPRTSPTYIPLGTAYLAAIGGAEELSVFDANIELWNHVCDTSAGLTAMRNFSHAPLEVFLCQENYEKHFSHMPEVRRIIDVLERKAKHFIECGELDNDLAQMLLRQSIRIRGGDECETVAFSIMYTDQLAFAAALAKYLKTICNYGADMVFGGSAMSAVSPLELLDAMPYISAILTGEGEIGFNMLLQNTPHQNIPGAFFRDNNGNVSKNASLYVKDLSQIAFPDFSSFRQNDYFNPEPVMPILAGRGCKWRKCSFCFHNTSFGTYRERPVLAVVQEMIQLQSLYGCRHFYFADQYIAPEELEQLCDTILAAGLACRFQIMARTVAGYTPQLLKKAAMAGCCWISWGMESGSQAMLDIMNKGTDVNISAQVITDAATAGISNLLMMIFGAPGSNSSYLDETFGFLDRIYPHIDAMTASSFILFDQTRFSRDAAKFGLEILGRNELFNIGGKRIHDARLKFKRQGEEGSYESPLGAREIELWERRKVWLPELPFFGKLCCEHYLLYSSSRDGIWHKPKHIRKGA